MRETQAYFDSMNQTADFWTLLAAGTITLAPGEDPQGRPVIMASDGNIDLRVQAVPTTQQGSDRIGVLTVTTREVSGTGVSHLMTAGIVVKNNPSTLEIDDTVFNELLPALYESAGNALVALAVNFAQDSQVESPDVDAESLASKALFSASQKAIGLAATLVEYGLEFTAVTWGQIVGEALGVGALMAIPAIVEFLGHTMRHSVVVENLTSTSVAWQLSTIHGENTVNQPATPIPGQHSTPDPLQPTTTLTLSSQLHLLHVNTTRESSIGYVLGLTPQDGSPTAQVLVNVPWAGDNVIWVGQSDDPASTIWDNHYFGPDTPLTTTATVGNYSATVTLNQLRGEHDGAYFYCSSILISPAN
ncbi:hypothetical protein [Microlunatus sp. Gsoil 973]|uniref:hypothetical protein n=1 Tax=Microlunatus sp. Gsoil 973 TaxID=2672569 RepID=UPI0012B4C23A|nr:hypothetical protein [Microlunatus sp. Gsoil 973]QGN31677.1 hypothetical protein GJV80_01235 [Microlunatus sp. Gsoil 973]